MRGFFNDILRGLIGVGFAALGLPLEMVHRAKISLFAWNQGRLRRRFGVTADTPVLAYGPTVEKSIKEAASRAGRGTRFALTSGSSTHPKRILYTQKRLRSVALTFLDVFIRCYRAFSIHRKSLYCFSALGKDESLTSMLLDEARLPPYLVTLQAPYRLQGHPAVQALADSYGATALRLWILALANPGVLYSTNPSTMSTFLDQLLADWPRSARLVRDLCARPQDFDDDVHAISRRLASRGSATRLVRIATSDAPLLLRECVPGVEACVCWTGGYVKPFVDRLQAHLPPERYRLIPMYSMSTETIETVSHFHDGSVAFLPLAPGVLVEFSEESVTDRPENLLTVDRLEVGKTYALVVSDAYGLRRYQTDDVFLCRGIVRGLPDLHFIRRRGLEYSLTGEKLTAEHTRPVFVRLREEFPALTPGDFLTCIPSQPDDERIPHYKLVLVGDTGQSNRMYGDALAGRCDILLGEVNQEYRGKRNSDRLGSVRFVHLPLAEFVDRVGGLRHRHTWESQFKFLPLYRRTWEEFRNGEAGKGPSAFVNP